MSRVKELFETEHDADTREAEIIDQRLTRVIHRYPENGKIVLEYEPKESQ